MPSAVIQSYRYDKARQELLVVFQSGRRYLYQNVPQETADGMKSAFAKGVFFNAHIRDRFGFVQISPVEKCHPFSEPA